MKFGKIKFKKDVGCEIIIKFHYVIITVKKMVGDIDSNKFISNYPIKFVEEDL